MAKNYEMPEHFRFKLNCKDCPAGLEADGHYSMSVIDAYLSAHIEAFGHVKYDLQIILPERQGTVVAWG
jgi:hypothetical protein